MTLWCRGRVPSLNGVRSCWVNAGPRVRGEVHVFYSRHDRPYLKTWSYPEPHPISCALLAGNDYDVPGRVRTPSPGLAAQQ